MDESVQELSVAALLADLGRTGSPQQVTDRLIRIASRWPERFTEAEIAQLTLALAEPDTSIPALAIAVNLSDRHAELTTPLTACAEQLVRGQHRSDEAIRVVAEAIESHRLTADEPLVEALVAQLLSPVERDYIPREGPREERADPAVGARQAVAHLDLPTVTTVIERLFRADHEHPIEDASAAIIALAADLTLASPWPDFADWLLRAFNRGWDRDIQPVLLLALTRCLERDPAGVTLSMFERLPALSTYHQLLAMYAFSRADFDPPGVPPWVTQLARVAGDPTQQVEFRVSAAQALERCAPGHCLEDHFPSLLVTLLDVRTSERSPAHATTRLSARFL